LRHRASPVCYEKRSTCARFLGFVGISPVRDTLVGMVDKLGQAGVRKWQDKLRALGAQAV